MYSKYAAGLTNVTIGNGVTTIGVWAFSYCPSLISVYFNGNALGTDASLFSNDNNPTVYYLPGTTGWSDFSTDTGVPIVL